MYPDSNYTRLAEKIPETRFTVGDLVHAIVNRQAFSQPITVPDDQMKLALFFAFQGRRLITLDIVKGCLRLNIHYNYLHTGRLLREMTESGLLEMVVLVPDKIGWQFTQTDDKNEIKRNQMMEFFTPEDVMAYSRIKYIDPSRLDESIGDSSHKVCDLIQAICSNIPLPIWINVPSFQIPMIIFYGFSGQIKTTSEVEKVLLRLNIIYDIKHTPGILLQLAKERLIQKEDKYPENHTMYRIWTFPNHNLALLLDPRKRKTLSNYINLLQGRFLNLGIETPERNPYTFLPQSSLNIELDPPKSSK